jgi:hypothetical protein
MGNAPFHCSGTRGSSFQRPKGGDYCRQLHTTLGCRELSSSVSKAALSIGTITTVVALILLIVLVRIWTPKCELENIVPKADHLSYSIQGTMRPSGLT